MKPTEGTISSRFHALAAKHGITTIKLTTLGRFGVSGWPDRLVLGPGGKVVFVEFKRSPKGKPTPRQKAHHRTLEKLGFTVLVEHDAREAFEHVCHHFDYYPDY